MSKELPGVSTMSLKMDMIHFQDEILRDMRQMQSKLDIKYAKSSDEMIEKLTKYDSKIKSLEKKVSELSNLITSDKSMKEKIESLFQFKEETQDTIFKRRAKFAEFEKKVNDDIDSINKIISNTVIYPGIIGKNTKFQSFHEFIDFCIQEITQLNFFKQKSGLDLGPFKKKIDGALDAFKIQMNNFYPKEIVNQMVNDLEEKTNSNFKLIDDRIKDIRVENAEYSIEMQKKGEEMDKQIDNLRTAQRYIDRKLGKIQSLENYQILGNDIMEANNRINKIFEILRDLVSYHPEVKKIYINEFGKPIKKIISGVRQYIKGNLNAEELSSMKKFTFEKKVTKNYDKVPQILPKTTTQNASPDSIFFKLPDQKRQSIFLDQRPSLDFVNKKFLSKKTVNLNIVNQINNNNGNINNNDNNKIIEPEKFRRGTLTRKNTVSFGKNTFFESSKMNNYSKKTNNFKNGFLNGQIGQKDNNIIEEENEVNNNSNNSVHDIKENNYVKSSENENNKNETIKNIKNIILKKEEEKRDISPQKENNIKFKSINDIDISKDDKINLNESEKKIEINNDINKKDEEKKNITLINLNKEEKNNSENIQTNDNIKQEQEVKQDILDEQENKNNHARNNKIIILNKNGSDKDNSLEQKSTNINNATKEPAITSKINLQEKKLQESSNSKADNKIHLSDSNKLLIPVNYNIKLTNPEISILSIKKKFNKTFSSFPKLNNDLTDNKIKLNNYMSIPTTREIYTKTITGDKYNRNTINSPVNMKQPKKILLMNPDDLPLNYFDKAFKDIMKNNLGGKQTDKVINNKNKIDFFGTKNKDNININTIFNKEDNLIKK